MASQIHFGPRLDCFADSDGPPFTLSPSIQNKRYKANRGQFTVFDDEPVTISPSHPLARQQVELSEVWTRKNEDLDWNSLICRSDSSKQQKTATPESLDNLTSLRMTKSWMAKANFDADVQKPFDYCEMSPTSSTKQGDLPKNVVIRSRRSDPTTASRSQSTTGEEDSRLSFHQQDLTGPVLNSDQTKKLMHYMGVNNLNFDIARHFAPTDNEHTYIGTMTDGVFRAASSGSEGTVEERILPRLTRTIRSEKESKLRHSLRRQGRNLQDIIRQVDDSRDGLSSLTADCHATLDCADQMMQRASDWFQMMLDDLEKRIKDEKHLVSIHRDFLDKQVSPILKKLHYLTMLYETLNYLDKRTSVNDRTMRTSRRNKELARECITKLSSQQQPTTEPSFLVKNEPAPLAAEISSSFHGLEQALIEMMKYVHGSPAANGFLETIMAQMNGIHKGVMNEVPGTTMTQYLTTLGTASENKEKGYAEAEAKTSSQASSSKKTATDHPPTVINSQVPTDSDKSPGITFESAKIIANPRQKIGITPSSIPSTSSQVSQPTSSSYVPPQKTPDPVKLSAAKAALKQISNKPPEVAQTQKDMRRNRRSLSSKTQEMDDALPIVSSTRTSKKSRTHEHEVLTKSLSSNSNHELFELVSESTSRSPPSRINVA
uniref:AIP3 domain-containing protein n=1 Tax=Haemonchus contortus TaxID=6289 RepID=A0A7I5E711_HAECO